MYPCCTRILFFSKNCVNVSYPYPYPCLQPCRCFLVFKRSSSAFEYNYRPTLTVLEVHLKLFWLGIFFNIEDKFLLLLCMVCSTRFRQAVSSWASSFLSFALLFASAVLIFYDCLNFGLCFFQSHMTQETGSYHSFTVCVCY